MNGLVHGLETVAKGLLHVADAVELRIMRAHHRAVVTEQLLAAVAEVAQGLPVKHACLRERHVRVQNRLCAKGALIGQTHRVTCRCSKVPMGASVCGESSTRFGLTHLAFAHVAHGFNVAGYAGEVTALATPSLGLGALACGRGGLAGLARARTLLVGLLALAALRLFVFLALLLLLVLLAALSALHRLR